MKTSIIQYAGLALLSILTPVALATTFTVSTTADSGSGSLRDAINQANNDTTTPVLIDFNVPAGLLTPTGVAVIQPQTPFPVIQNINGLGITIDGYSQAGSSFVSGNTSSLVVKVELDGSLIPVPYVPPPPSASQFAHGLHIMSSDNRVQGLCVHSFPHDGISIQGIWPGTAGHPGSNLNQIYWNLVGTDVTGLTGMPNGLDTGSLWGGIYVKVLPGSPGIANGNHILENVVSGNAIEGVGISNCPDEGSDVRQNHVERCYVGIDITGIGPLGNGHDGIYIGEGAHHNVLDQNWVGANGYSGVGIVGYGPSGLSTHSNTLTRNRIGVDVNLSPMGNTLHGVAIGSYGGLVWGFAPNNLIDDNIIAYNQLTGVAVQDESTDPIDDDTSFNTITQNAIHHNGYVDPGYLGIDLAFEPGVTANDVGDPDLGPNRLINFPVITSALYNAGASSTTVSGTLDISGVPANVEVFTAIPGADGSNHGQGAIYLGNITTVGATWTVVLTSGGQPGQWLTATATDTMGNTSEFSQNVPVWEENQHDLDFGDAPDPSYPTLAANGGPAHVIVPGMYLGMSVDGEADGQPNASATGDDNDGNDDENGVTFPVSLVAGQTAQIDIVASVQGQIDAWIDFDGNGTWNPVTERIVNSAYHPGGWTTVSYNFTVPATAVGGSTFARIRYSSGGNLLPTGPGAGGSNPDGEVEDHQVHIEGENPDEYDWGDAPDQPYPTLAINGGAQHLIVPGVYLGGSVDAEGDGQPDPHALGDDSMVAAGTDDEDGVIFLSPVVLGGTVSLSVTASVSGNLDAWVDFNGNGNWTDPSDQIFNGQALGAGLNSLTFPVPASASSGTTYARFRFTTVAGAGLTPTGLAPDGEVEDYILEIEDGEIPHKMHWAQLPDPTGWDVRGYHPKILADDFRCTASGPITTITFWGSWRDDEVGQIENVHLSLHKDDRSGEFSKPGELLWQVDTATAELTVQFDDPEFGAQGWYDPNTGEWNRPDHQMYFKYTVMIPEDMAFVQEEGTIYWLDLQVECFEGEWGWKTSRSAHFEDDAVWDDTPQMPANWQELIDPETLLSLDLAFVIDGPEQQVDLDFGDAPDTPGAVGYRTLLANNGARHLIATDVTGNTIRLGPAIDAEPDGQPTTPADGDDLNGSIPDDEDGVFFPTALIPGIAAMIQVQPSTAGFLNAWIDLNGDGDWADGGEWILNDVPVNTGINSLGIVVPVGTLPGQTYARFRFTTQPFTALPGLNEGGAAPDGEVEDYLIHIDEPVDVDWGDAPDGPYSTVLLSNGPRHIIVPGYHMGASVDGEPNGQPDPNALGDDLIGVPDDEDGVFFYPLFIGQQSAIDVTVTGAGMIDAWIDFNNDGTWGPAEQIGVSVPVTPGLNQLTFSVPGGSVTGSIFARIRFSSVGGLGPIGAAPDGEVEDYEVKILPEGDVVYDFGDAPDFPVAPLYPTLAANNGARHLLGGPLWMGSVVDAEADGQPDPAALGDDFNLVYPGGPDDEDGVTFGYALIANQPTLAQIVASAPGAVDMWIDWNGNGSWADLGEHVLMAQPVSPGPNYVTMSVPLGVATGPTKARVRISNMGGLPTTGFAPDGEVEDHDVFLYETGAMDFGDAPDMSLGGTTSYPTTMTDFGAAHFIDSLFLGWLIDGETDGQASLNATGDDLAGGPDDEDGITFDTVWISGSNAQFTVTVNPATVGTFDLDLWVDWDGDGTWMQADEHVLAAQPVIPGPNPFTITVPASMGPVWTYARFRLTHAGTGIGFSGFVQGGEVEDYEVPIGRKVRAGIQLDRTTTPTKVVLSWSAMTGAVSYSVYSSTNLLPTFPNPPNWALETSITGLTWNEPITVPRKFYIVVAFP